MTYYKKFIDFLKNNNLYTDESFIYISRQTTNIDYENKEERQNIGCHKEIKDSKLKKFKVCVPEIKDEETLLININNYVKSLYLYEMLGKTYQPGLEEEIIGLLYEKIYILTKERSKYERLQQTSPRRNKWNRNKRSKNSSWNSR